MFDLSAEEMAAIALSLKVSLWAVAASLPLAIGAAWMLSRQRFRGMAVLDGLVHMPLTLPPVVTGYLLLLLLGRRGWLGGILDDAFGIVFSFRWTGAALACAVMGFPLLVRAIRLSIDSVDRRLEDAAGSLGAHPLWVFLTITLPLTVPGILAGMVLGFARSMGEFGATVTFVSNIPGETQTLPTAIYSLIQVPGGDAPALRLMAISVAISMTALVLSEILVRRFTPRASLS
jgi:molybdate transport system permease protein